MSYKRAILFTAKTALLPLFVVAMIFGSLADSLLDFKKLLKEWYE